MFVFCKMFTWQFALIGTVLSIYLLKVYFIFVTKFGEDYDCSTSLFIFDLDPENALDMRVEICVEIFFNVLVYCNSEFDQCELIGSSREWEKNIIHICSNETCALFISFTGEARDLMERRLSWCWGRHVRRIRRNWYSWRRQRSLRLAWNP